jgi:two-component system cell cycle sensor histidine kinase/response regulator CckA
MKKIFHYLNSLICETLLFGKICQTLICIIIIFVACIFLPPPSEADEKKVHKVLILNSYHTGYKWSDDIIKGVKETFKQTDMTIELYLEYLDTKRFKNPNYLEDLYKSIANKYKNISFDVIITSDDTALDFLLKYRSVFQPKAPVVFCGVNFFNPEIIANQFNISGVVEETGLKETIDLALKQNKKARKLVFITSTNPTSFLELKQLEKIQPVIDPKYDIEIWKDIKSTEGETKLKELPSDVLVIFTGAFLNEKGEYLLPLENTRAIVSASPVPVYTLWDFSLGLGVVGGHMVNGLDQGLKAAELALQILSGKPISELPVVMESPRSYMFDYTQLKRFNINLSTLPEKSIIINQPYSLYEGHKTTIWMVISTILFLLIIITLLIFNIRKRYQVESILKNVNADLDQTVKDNQATEKALAIGEEKYRNLIDKNPDLSYRTDKKGRVIFVSRVIKDFLGYTVQEAMGMDIAKDIYKNPGDRETLLAALKKNGSVSNFVSNLKRKDGSFLWASTNAHFSKDQNGNIIGVEGVTRDITKEKIAEEALRESEETYRNLFHNAQVGLFRSRIKDGKILESNDQTAQMFGYRNRADFIKKFKTSEHYVNLELREQMVKQIIEEGELKNVEVEFYRKDMSTFWARYSCRIYPEKGWVEGIIEDISDQKSTEKEKVKLEAQLQQSQKMEAIGTLAGGIAHDFNNILGAILGYTELAITDTPDDSEIILYLTEVLNAAHRAKNLTGQILTFSRRKDIEPKPVKVKLIANEVLDLLKASLPSTIEIKTNLISESLTMADPTEIHQVLMNLCTNAWHAMQNLQEGILDMQLTDVVVKNDFAIVHQITPGYYQKLSIKDNGYGIKPALLEKIFDPFFTTKSEEEGTGLGLSVVHGIVKNFNGAIDVNSEPGKGTTFDIFWPVVNILDAHQVVLEDVLPKGTESILYIDDDKIMQGATCIMLKRLGYTVTSMLNSIEALELFSQNPSGFDIVITDLTMPKMTGIFLLWKC